MGNYQTDFQKQGKYFTAIVCRDPGNGIKVFHKYRNIPMVDRKVIQFQRVMQRIHADQGKVIHINYYFKDNRQFSHRWYSE